MGDDDEVYSTLRNVFKKQEFRYPQEEIVRASIKGHDLLVLLPTGHGKSLTYQLPSVVPSGAGKVTIVISPLLALIANQITGLHKLKINAVTLNASMEAGERKSVLRELTHVRPTVQMLYISPELCATPGFRKVLRAMYNGTCSIARFVIDEAHCCDEWGSNFRKDYANLNYLREKFPTVPITALTATAGAKVQKRIIEILKLDKRNLRTYKTSVNRPNLHYEVRYFSDPDHHDDIIPDIVQFLTEYKKRREASKSASSGAGIIYCRRKDTVEEVAMELSKAGFGARAFHGSLPTAEKKEVMDRWVSNVPGYEIVVATVAFGMGVDKPDVRFVVHVDLPASIETYYQATGRAGRDGKGARCILYYSREERSRVLMLNRNDASSSSTMGLQYLVQYCERTNMCRHLMLCSYFEQNVPKTSSKEWCFYACDYCKDNRAVRRQAQRLTETESFYD